MKKLFNVRFFDGKDPEQSNPLTDWVEVQLPVDPAENVSLEQMEKDAAIQALEEGATKVQPASAYVTHYDPHAGKPFPVMLLSFTYPPRPLQS